MSLIMVIDTTSMKFIASTNTMQQAEYLGDIYCPTSNAHIDHINEHALSVFSNKELANIYTNTENSPLQDKHLRDREMLEGLIYHLGTTKKDDRSVESLHATLGHVPVKPAPIPATEPKTAATPRTSGTGERRGGAKELIFALADAAWEAAGKPTDIATVLKLRKQWMGEWEASEGIKRTTASSTLGAWQKERLTG